MSKITFLEFPRLAWEQVNIYATIYKSKHTKGREVNHNHKITTLLLTITLALLLSACNTKTSQDKNNTTGSSNPTRQTGDIAVEANVTRSVEVINVTPTLSSLSLESNATTVNVGETVQLSVMGMYSDNSTKAVDENITYIISPVENAEVNGSVLTALKDGSVTVQAKVGTTLSNTINLNIIWVVNGHTLPPEPNEVLNNATLLGIDSNNNGVRDDVERWIYETYGHPIERAVFIQLAKALQYRMGHANEAWKYRQPTSDAVTCSSYWEDPSPYPIRINNYKTPADELQPIQYNTQLRKLDNDTYQKALSGGVIQDNGLEPEEWIQKCQFDANTLMKDYISFHQSSDVTHSLTQ